MLLLFYQRKKEWVNLYEKHPDLFANAQRYEEKTDFAGNYNNKFNGLTENLAQLVKEKRAFKISMKRKKIATYF